jgi:hypothetical protein
MPRRIQVPPPGCARYEAITWQEEEEEEEEEALNDASRM